MIAIIDSGGANIGSIRFALQRLGCVAELTCDVKVIQQASHVILPGVGAAAAAMARLENFKLVDVLRGLQQPVLGICLGMQLLYDFSEEGQVACLGIIAGTVKKFVASAKYSVPHMGWNTVQQVKSAELLTGVKNNSYVYFVHSYAAPVTAETIASTDYIFPFTAIVQKNNFYGMQFHPERSSEVGSQLLKNFLEL